MKRGEWFVWTDDARRGPNASVFAFRHRARSAAVVAQMIAADYDARRVTVEYGGRPVGVYTGALWVQVTSPDLQRAIEWLDQR